jgi:queuosine biosynthesis protein QueD
VTNAIRIELGTFDAAHQIPTHHGKCKNLHGHTYRVFAEVTGDVQEDDPDRSDYGMVIDFGVIKDLYKAKIHARLDHAFITGSFLPRWVPLALGTKAVNDLKAGKPLDGVEQGGYFEGLGLGKVAYLNLRVTTAENLAQWIADELVLGLTEMGGGLFKVTRVEVWETPTSCGVWVYTPDDDGRDHA